MKNTLEHIALDFKLLVEQRGEGDFQYIIYRDDKHLITSTNISTFKLAEIKGFKDLKKRLINRTKHLKAEIFTINEELYKRVK